MPLIQHRAVWYFHGFDPASTARYRRIFESASGRLGVRLEDLPDGEEGWSVASGPTTTDFHYLRYEALVRAAQAGGPLTRLGRGLRTLVGYVADGALFRLSARSAALAVSPYIVAFGPLVFAALTGLDETWSMVAFVALALAAAVMLFRLRMILVCDLFAFMRMLAKGSGRDWGTYHDRIDDLAGQIDPHGAEETVIVGHSLGGVAAIFAVRDLLERLPTGARIGLVTLGSVHGIVLTQKGRGRDKLAEAIAQICRDERLTWLDVSSPRDAFCVPLTDPLVQIGDLAVPGMRSPMVISAPLARAPRIPGDRRTVFSAMRRHMGYLLAPPPGHGGFDYAELLTSPMDLPARLSERGNSPKARMWQG